MTEIFWSLVISTLSGICLGLGALCYKSKCDKINMPCLKIHRNVSLEEKIDEIEINNKNNNNI